MKLITPHFRLIFSTLALVVLFYSLLPEASASGIPYPAPGGVPGASLSSGGTPQGAVVGFAVLLQRVADGLAALAASVAILFVVINGARLTFAFGNSEAVTKARKGLIWAAAGLVVIIFAYIITKSVIALVYSGADGSAVIGTANLAPTTTTPGTIDPINDGEVGEDGTIYLPAGQRRLSFFQQGVERTFVVYVPSRLDSTKEHPAVLVLHDELNDVEGMVAMTNMNTKANQERFIAVYPEVTGRAWNDGRSTTQVSFDDVIYIETVLNVLEDDWQIDRDQVFATGFGSGGMMTQRLACELSSEFAGFAVVAANMPVDLEWRCNGRGPMLFINGTTDPIMPYGGGEIAAIPALGVGPGGTVLAIEATLALWAGNNRCNGSTTETLEDIAPDDTIVDRVTYNACSQGDLIAYTVNNGGHNWPGAVGASSLTGNVSRDIIATDEMTEFFKANGLTPAS